MACCVPASGLRPKLPVCAPISAAGAAAGLCGGTHPAYAKGTDADDPAICIMSCPILPGSPACPSSGRSWRASAIQCFGLSSRTGMPFVRETMCQALVGNYREEHVFALTQALELYDVYQTKVTACDKQIQAILMRLKQTAPSPRTNCFPSAKILANHMRRRSTPARTSRDPWRGPHSDRRPGTIPRAEAGRGVRHHPERPGRARNILPHGWRSRLTTRFLGEGAVVENATHQQSGGVAVAPRRRQVGRTDTALGAFYRRLSARWEANDHATARKIAVLFYNTLRTRHVIRRSRASYYETATNSAF